MDGGYLPLGRGRQRKILAALLLNANRPVSTNRLIDVVWGDESPSTARQQTQNSIGMLRSALAAAGAESRIHRQSATYTLEIEEAQIDSFVFRSQCTQAQRAVECGDGDRAALHLEEALALWCGPALEDIHSAALLANAEELEARRLEAAQALVATRFEQGRHTEMIGKLTVWTAEYPYHEAFHRALAEALQAASRVGDALRVLSALRERLDRELSIGPEPATQDLELRLANSHALATGGQEPGTRELIEALREVTHQLSAVTRMMSKVPPLRR
ncbi:BTAD domain-containing putative transcriptional regulator [Actinoplanes sp. NPDC049668]|uniref:AfsR/SARP family transcriptional regulator n=1 Tax=unclassified Actinoplanes TaxID=2626549 RepID=UPI0033A129A5